mgnify:CR=1 FL=1
MTPAATATLTRDQILALYVTEIENSADPLLNKSFRQYAIRRDQLAALYEQTFRIITADEFISHLALVVFMRMESHIRAERVKAVAAQMGTTVKDIARTSRANV